MAATQKSGISFGLVYFPIALYTATQDADIHFNQLCKEDNSRIRYKKVCASCGKEVKTGDIIRGYEYGDNQYVIVGDEDLEKIKTEKDKSIQILHVTDLRSIRPIYFDKTYHIQPEPGGEKAFELFRRALLEESKVAIGKTVLGNTETLITIIPTENGLLAETMFFLEEIKNAPKEFPQQQIKEEELDMAKMLVNSMNKEFDPSLYKNEYQARLRELIEKKISGQEIVQAQPEGSDKIINIMEALQASLKQVGQTPKKPGRPRKTKGA